MGKLEDALAKSVRDSDIMHAVVAATNADGELLICNVKDPERAEYPALQEASSTNTLLAPLKMPSSCSPRRPS